MTDISDDRVDQLLREAEQRLKNDAATSNKAIAPIIPKAAGVKPGHVVDVQKAITKKDLSVRAPTLPQIDSLSKDTAGANWFNMPKAKQTPEFKRDWELLRMRGVLDPKHQKKALRAAAPQYAQVGQIISGPTEIYSARLTKKERKGTILEEVMSTYDADKYKNKYAGIQKQKASGKKAFYKQVVAQRRKRR